MLILGVPEQDGEMMHRLTGQLFSPLGGLLPRLLALVEPEASASGFFYEAMDRMRDARRSFP